ncbi:hypothetical protein SVAN01_07657 [Stagonosporopsis vannaccii]|nr:hypothetical protein SVAN01_07657 [Stagonosporopsis vannaccii]
MALNGDARRSPEQWHGKPPTHSSFDSWVNKNGKDAYKHFVKDHPKTDLSYEAWRQTDRVYGGYLFYVASLVWADDDDSDEESVKRRRISRVQSDSKKTAITNGRGASRTAGSATPTSATTSAALNVSGKRKRKPRKKYMSQELVASDEEAADEVDASTPPTEAETPAKAEVAVNGRRKSTSRKPRKKPISDETISPEDEDEDEDEDAMDVDVAVIDSPLPVRSAPHASATFRQSESPNKATPKQTSTRKSRESFLVRLPFHLWDAVNLKEKSEELELDEDPENGDASIAEVSRPATTPASKFKSESSNETKTDANTDDTVEALTAEGTPDAANTRRGLRNRKPAQQRPYYHDAQVFEEVETEHDDESELGSLSRERSSEPLPPSKPKHFKGKGRAWKKDDSDEDEEFVTPKEKKAAKVAKAKAERDKVKMEKETNENGNEDITSALMDILNADRAELSDRTAQTNGLPNNSTKQKKSRKPRKSSLLSEDLAHEAPGSGNPQAAPAQPPKRGRGRPRKSALSSEIVRDESDDEGEALAQAAETADTTAPTDLTTPPKSKPTSRPSTATSTAPATTPKKRGRPRKSDTVTTSAKLPAKVSEATEEAAQRRDSTATEAAEPKMCVSESAPSAPAVADYPMPVLYRGAALVESLYPREASELATAPSTATAESEPVQSSAPSAEAPLAHVEVKEPVLASDADAHTDAKADADADADADAKPGEEVRTVTIPSPAVPAASPTLKTEDKNELREERGHNDIDDARSAAMSLGSSSDAEL